jgi:riboflavin kinase/FMN adenylyltransferase
MRILKMLRGDASFPAALKQGVMCIGNFDGMHLGHQALIAETLRLAKINPNAPKAALLMTFEPHPAQIVDRHKGLKHTRLMRFKSKYQWLQQCTDLDAMVVLKFNVQLSTMPAEIFIKDILKKHCDIAEIVVGQDFRFGQDRLGDIALIRGLGVCVTVVPDVFLDEQRISSSWIRSCLQEGRCADAQRALGRHYSVRGVVERGLQQARLLGASTANIRLPPSTVSLSGVFVVQIRWASQPVAERVYWGVANWGRRPTLVRNGGTVLEVHLLDLDPTVDLYGCRLEVFFVHLLRLERQFDGIEALRLQIQEDLKQARILIGAG